MDTATVHRRRWYTLAAMCLMLVVLSVDNTILYVALPTLVEDLGPTASQLQWVVDGYVLVFAVLLLTAGTLGDRFGRRGALVVGLLVFGGGSLAAALADSPTALIVARGVMGLGAAAIMPSTLSIITNVFTDRAERARAIGIWAGSFGLGVAIGPLAGGWLLEHFWWGSVFLVNIPVVVLALAVVPAFVPTSRDPAAPPVDVVGAVLSVATLGSLVWAIIEAPLRGWTSTPILVAFGLAAVFLVAFALWELRTPHPMLNLRFFRDPRFSAAGGTIALMFFSMFGSLYLLTQHLQFVLGYDAMQTGVRVIPVAVAIAVAAPLSVALTKRFGFKIVIAAGMVLLTASFVVLTRLTVDSGYVMVISAITLLGFGTGLAMAPATDAIMASLPAAKAGVGSAVNDMLRQVGGALGVAVLGSLMSSAYHSDIDSSFRGGELAKLPLDPAAHDLVRDQLGGAVSVAQHVSSSGLTDVAAVITDSARSAFVDGLSGPVAIVAAAIAAVGVVVAAIWMPRGHGDHVASDTGGTGGTGGPELQVELSRA